MPHLDFRHVFESSSGPSPKDIDAENSSPRLTDPAGRQRQRTLATRLPRLHQDDRTTILFAILIFVGGLFCAFYFFNGVENLRAAAAWSRELLYHRPDAIAANAGQSDISAKPNENAATPAKNSGKPETDKNNTAPFSRNLGSLYPSSPNNGSLASPTASLPGVTLPSNPGSLLNQLGLPPSGGGALAQTFDRAVADVARVSNLLANAPLQVVKVPAPKPLAKVNAQARKTEVRAVQNTGARVNELPKNGQNAAEQAGRTLDRTSLENPTTIIAGRDFQRSWGSQSLGSGTGGIGGLGGRGLGGPGGAGAMGGGLGGAVGGALGGLGGGK